MTVRYKYLLLAFLTILPATVEAKSPKATTEDYVLKAASDGGTGKWFMGREIAAVMGHDGIKWLEREERAVEEKPQLIAQQLRLKPTDKIADIGAGSGVITFTLAPLVMEGKVYATDIQPEMLRIIDRKRQEKKFDNIELVLGTVTDPRLPEAGLDAVLLVDSYHEFSHPVEMMSAIKKSLRPGGKVFLVEFRGEDKNLKISSHHKMTEEQVKTEMAAHGFRWIETKHFLPRQHFLVFKKR